MVILSIIITVCIDTSLVVMLRSLCVYLTYSDAILWAKQITFDLTSWQSSSVDRC